MLSSNCMQTSPNTPWKGAGNQTPWRRPYATTKFCINGLILPKCSYLSRLQACNFLSPSSPTTTSYLGYNSRSSCFRKPRSSAFDDINQLSAASTQQAKTQTTLTGAKDQLITREPNLVPTDLQLYRTFNHVFLSWAPLCLIYTGSVLTFVNSFLFWDSVLLYFIFFAGSNQPVLVFV